MIDPKDIKKALTQINFYATRVTPLNRDARGSLPYVATDGNQKVFLKVRTARINAADWMFKLWRRLLFRRLEDEVPFISPKQALEHEAYVSSLAYEHQIRTPKPLGVLDLGNYHFALVHEMVDGDSLDMIAKRRLTPKVQAEIWQQVHKLHVARIAHRDLRAANIILDKADKPWIIDFDFATIAASALNMRHDNLEILASLSVLVGAGKAVKAASTVLTTNNLRRLSPILRYKMLSAATRDAMRAQPALLNELGTMIETYIANHSS